MTPSRDKGQALLELAVCLPAVVLLAVMAYAGCRAAHLRSAGSSAAQSELLRTGRRLDSFGDRLRKSLEPHGRGVSVGYGRDRWAASRLVPGIPVPAMAGRDSATVGIEKTWEEVWASGEIPRLRLSRRTEAAVDCWDDGSPSGKKLKKAVDAVAALGFLR